MPTPDAAVPDAAVPDASEPDAAVSDEVLLRWGRITWTAGETGAGRVYGPATSENGQLRLRGVTRQAEGGRR